MSNDELVAELNKRLDVKLEYSDTIAKKASKQLDKTKLKKLAHSIRKNLEELTVETSMHPHPGVGSK